MAARASGSQRAVHQTAQLRWNGNADAVHEVDRVITTELTTFWSRFL
jgi:hypothetical protein